MHFFKVLTYKKSRLPGFIQKDDFNILQFNVYFKFACAAATRAIGTRYGEQLT